MIQIYFFSSEQNVNAPATSQKKQKSSRTRGMYDVVQKYNS